MSSQYSFISFKAVENVFIGMKLLRFYWAERIYIKHYCPSSVIA